MKPRPSVFLTALAVSSIVLPARAANEFWNPTPLTGTWDTVTPNWAITSGGTADQLWTNGNDATFDQASPYTVTVAEALTAGIINLSAGDVTFNGLGGVKANTVTIGAGATVRGDADRIIGAGTTALQLNGTLNLTNGSGAGRFVTLTGNGTVSGNSGLRFGGASDFSGNVGGTGSVILENGSINFSGANTYSGDTLLRAATGTLRLSSADALSANTLLRFGTGTNVVELASGNFSRALGSTGGTVRFNAGADGAGNSGFAAIGADRTVALTGGLIWGSAEFNPTQFILGNANSTHKVTLTSNLDLNTDPLITRTLFSTDGSAAVEGEISGVISGAGVLAKRGTGTILLSGTNTFTGATIDLSAGAGASNSPGFLRLSSNEALGPDATVKTIAMGGSTGAAVGGIELTNNITVSNKNFNVGGRTVGPTFAFLRNVSGTNTWNGGLLITGAGGGYSVDTLAGTLILAGNLQNNITASTRGFVFRNDGDSIISGTIKNNGTGLTSIDKGGAGTMTITSTTGNTATGGITITAGILSLGDGTIGKDGVLANTNNISITAAGNLTFNRFGPQTYGGVISGAGTVTKTGAGAQTLTGTNTWSGTTLVSQGTLDANKTTALALGTGAVTVSSGATLKITNHAGGGQLAYANNLTLTGSGDGGTGALFFLNSGGFDMSGTVAISGGTTIGTDPAGQAASSNINFTNVISGSGGLTLFANGSNSAGTPRINLSAASNYTGATLLTSGGVNTTPYTVTLTGGNDRLPSGTSLVFGGTPAGTPAGTYNKSVTLALDGVSQQVASLSTANAPATAGGYRIVGANATASTLVVNNPSAVSFDGVIGGAGTNENNLGLTKTGAGVLTLTGNNTFAGNTVVSAGTLYVNGNLANSAVTVNAGKFGGTSSNIGGGVTVGANGTLAPGNSIGTLGLSAADLAGTLEIEYATSAIDLLNVVGALNLNGATVSFVNSGGALDGTSSYIFATYGSRSGTFAAANTPSGYKIDYAFGGNNIALVAIPEPASLLLGCIGMLALLRRRRA